MSAPLPFLVNQTRWSDLLKQLSVAKGLDHVEVLGQLIGAIILEDDRPEHKYLAGEALAFGQYLLAAQGAGIVGYIGLRNPTGSGKIVIVERCRLIVQSTSVRHYVSLVRGATLTQQNTEQPRDTRLQPTGAFGTAAPGIVGQIVSGRSDTIVVTPFPIAELASSFVATAVYQSPWEEPVVLAPGDTIIQHLSDGAGGNTANFAFEASYVWRERTLEPTET